jgi:hypothetical protein
MLLKLEIDDTGGLDAAHTSRSLEKGTSAINHILYLCDSYIQCSYFHPTNARIRIKLGTKVRIFGPPERKFRRGKRKDGDSILFDINSNLGLGTGIGNLKPAA